jgi:hypothetical protein
MQLGVFEAELGQRRRKQIGDGGAVGVDGDAAGLRGRRATRRPPSA